MREEESLGRCLTTIIQVRDDSGLAQGGSEDSEKWMHSGYVLKIEWIGFPVDQLKREKLEG